MRLAALVPVAFVASGFLSLTCQQGAPPSPTLRVNSRAVLIDVVVMDSNGNPVTGLQKSAFQIFDNGQPQAINAFEVHTGGIWKDSERLRPRSNGRSVAEEPSARNVLLIDTSRMDIVEQMSLYKQLVRFVQNLPPHVPIAVFLRSYAFPVMLQDFTTDHVLLEAAIAKAIPHLQKFGAAVSNPEAADYLGPQRIADYLSQVPGRKNLLWFLCGTNAGRSISLANAGISQDPGDLSENMHRIYDLSETARVSIYPIDVRGLQPQTDVTLPSQHLRETTFAE